MNRPPGPSSELLSDFSDFISDVSLQTGLVIIVGDFNIHVVVESDSPSFTALVLSAGFS